MTQKKRSSASQVKQDTARPSQKGTYRVRNWAEYNASLVQRGSVTVWIDERALAEWTPKVVGVRQRGGQVKYSDQAIECLLTLRAVFHLTLRQTEGFGRSILQMLRVEQGVPDYTTLCKRSAGLGVSLMSLPHGPLHIVMDSTGLKVYGEGEWKVRKYGVSKRRTWRKLHLSVDGHSQEIQAVVLTEAGVDDAEAGRELLHDTPGEIEQVCNDGGYDKRKFYEACTQRGIARITIPPQRNARIWQHGNCAQPPLPRDQNLRAIRRSSRRKWKISSGYHLRSLSETAMFRFKTIFSPTLASRKLETQQTEARIKCAALNRMTQLGMPDSYRVA